MVHVPDDCVMLPRHKQHEVLELLRECQQIVLRARSLAIVLLQAARDIAQLPLDDAVTNDATTAIESHTRLSQQLTTLITDVEHLERLTINLIDEKGGA